MYEVERRHSQFATEQPDGLLALYCSKRPAVPPVAWSSPVATTTAFLPRGKYHSRGNGLRLRDIVSIKLASKRCCSSACGTATFERSTQSALEPPKNRSSERIMGGAWPSRSCPAQAGLPWRVCTTERARS